MSSSCVAGVGTQFLLDRQRANGFLAYATIYFVFGSSKSVVASCALPINIREYLLALRMKINIINRRIGFDIMLSLQMKRSACLVYCLFVVAPLCAQDITKQGTLFNWACLLYTSPSPRD